MVRKKTPTKPRKQRGGKRDGAGRKKVPPESKKKPITVWLSPQEIRVCSRYGRTPQDGIRYLIQMMKDYQTRWGI